MKLIKVKANDRICSKMKLIKVIFANDDKNQTLPDGKYNNYTGIIVKNGCRAENGYFELSDNGSKLVFNRGILGGVKTPSDTTINGGEIRVDMWGTFNDGLFKGQVWYGNEWNNGIFDPIMASLWKRGTWKNGTWKDGNFVTGKWENGIWEHGIFHAGTWKNGTWKSGTWMGGTWKSGTLENCDWRGGIWQNGTWKNGIHKAGVWQDGTWENGTWKGGTWKGGTWKGGTWENGNWNGGTWKGGTWITGKINGVVSTTPPK